MKRACLLATAIILGFAGVASAQSSGVATTGPYNPAPPRQSADVPAHAPCTPETPLPDEAATKPKSGDLSGSPISPDARNQAAQPARPACSDQTALRVQPNAIPPRR